MVIPINTSSAMTISTALNNNWEIAQIKLIRKANLIIKNNRDLEVFGVVKEPRYALLEGENAFKY